MAAPVDRFGLTHYILDERGEPVETDLYTWAAWFEDPSNRVLAHDRDESGGRDILVSTIFLGIDHGYGGGPPLLWETMVLKDGGGDVYCERYTSRADAIAGHRHACKLANEGAFD
jgi:hypothetical protein